MCDEAAKGQNVVSLMGVEISLIQGSEAIRHHWKAVCYRRRDIYSS